MQRIIQKYGGSSLATTERVAAVARRIAEAARHGQIVAVLSAQGKTTDALLRQAEQYGRVQESGAARELAQLLACGEQMSVALCALTLRQLGAQVVSLNAMQAGLLAQGDWMEATPVALCNDRIERELAQGRIVLVTGFQGINAQGDLVTFGRGGSDTTAVALTYLLHAEKCQIFTDVDGVYTADPHQDPTAARFAELDYETMLTMARNGAKVLHTRCVELAMEHKILLEVRSSFHDGGGTIVHA